MKYLDPEFEMIMILDSCSVVASLSTGDENSPVDGVDYPDDGNE